MVKPSCSPPRTAWSSPPKRYSPSDPGRWSSSTVNTAPPSFSPMVPIHFAPRHCPLPRFTIPPEPGTPSPVVSWATLHRSRHSPGPYSKTLCSTEASWDRSRLSASAPSGSSRSLATRSKSAFNSSAASHILTNHALPGGAEVNIDRKDRNEKQVGNQDECSLVPALAFIFSVFAFAWFYRHGDILLYGDAVAHLNIARRLTDARNPGWDQIGSVWLPLPHLLVAPFVANDWLWRTGIGGSIPSMAAYVLGVAGIYRLVRARASRAGAGLAAAIYGLNPSMLYMQSTAMTESIFLAAVVWSVVYFDDFLRGLGGDSGAAIPAA